MINCNIKQLFNFEYWKIF